MEQSERVEVGSRVTIFRRGKNGTWTADYWHENQHRRMSLRTSNKKVALERAIKLSSELIDGKHQKLVNKTTIEAAVKAYLTYLEVEGRALRTVVRYRGELITFQEFCQSQNVALLTQISPAL